MPARELNLDGLPGPTHNFAGLAFGNIAAMRHRSEVSHPRRAALEGLAKMRLLHDFGIPQAVMPPHERPHLPTLRRLGFAGKTDADILARARREAPEVFLSACSSSGMWTANAATVSPAADTEDGRVHFTPANLASQFHRSIETAFTARLLKRIFPEGAHFAHHDPLPAGGMFRDEGAANHLRLCRSHGARGLEVFVWGASPGDPGAPATAYPARQTLQASQAVARRHGLDPRAALFVRQNPAAIDAGVFHNDVIALANESVLLVHSRAFAGGGADIGRICDRFTECDHGPLTIVLIESGELSLGDAVGTYLFNSQLVTLPDGSAALIAPAECREHPRARVCLDRVLAADNPVRRIEFVSLAESMKNGGGPACLRLRVALEDEALKEWRGGVRFDAALHERLTEWVEAFYRDDLCLDDLADPDLLEESRRALDALTGLLGLGPVYSFQREV